MLAELAQNSNYFTATYAHERAAGSVADGADALQAAQHEEATQKTRALSAQEETHPDGRKKDSFELSREAEEIRQLQARDLEVRTHEAAHAAAGGAYAGAPSFTYERGPDGQSYAVGGEVSIDVAPISGDPQATLQKAQQVRAAALAPAEPSGQDMKVAQRAQALAAKARAELAVRQTGETQVNAADSSNISPENPDNDQQVGADNTATSPALAGAVGSITRLNIYA